MHWLGWVLGLGAGATLLQGCYMVMQPGPVTNFLTAGDEELAQALRRAAADWARYGLDIANYVTVDDGKDGIPVQRVSYDELRQYCPDGPADPWGCTHWEMGDWLGLLVREDLSRDDLTYIVQHEMIHALVPKAPHLTTGQGIYTPEKTTTYITRADMAHLAKYTKVVPTEEQFLG